MVIAERQYFEDYKSQFQTELDNNLKIVRESYQGYLQVANEGNEEIDAKVRQIQDSAGTIATTLESVGQLFANAKTKLETELNNGKQEHVRAEADKAGKEAINNAEAQRQTIERAQSTQANSKVKTQSSLPITYGQGYANMGRIIGESLFFKPNKINDGVIAQNGNVIKIDNQDQILAAKEGGPVDKMLDTAQTAYSELPRENPYADNTNNGGKIEVAPIEIQLNGNIQLSGGNGTVDITSQIINDPIVMREITQIISKNIEMQINGGRVSNAFT